MPSVIIPPTDVSPNTGSGSEVLSTSPTIVTPTINTINSAAATNMTLNAGSSGATLVLGQGGAGIATLNRNLTVSGAVTANDFILGSGGPSLTSTVNARASRQGLIFDGTSECTVSNGQIIGTGDFTIGAWVTRSGSNLSVPIWGAANSIGVAVRATTITLDQPGGTGTVATWTYTVPSNKATFVVIQRSGTTATAYVDGVSLGTVSNSTNFSAAFSKVGLTSFSIGAIYGPYVYNRALSATEVVSLYEAGVPAQADYNNANYTSLITGDNSTFATDTGYWLKANGATIGSGTCVLSGTAYIARANLLTVGRRYRVQLTNTSGTGNVVVFFGDGTQIDTAYAAGMTVEGIVTTNGTLSIATSGNVTIDTLTIIPLGVLLAPDANQPGGGLAWYDTSGNNATITLPASGVNWNVRTSGKINAPLMIGGVDGGAKLNVYTPTTAEVGYLYGIRLSDESTSTLALGLQTPTGTVRPFIHGNVGLGFGTGGVAAVNITSGQQVQVLATTASNNTSSGALVVSGGIGVAGAINGGGLFDFAVSANSTQVYTIQNTSTGASASTRLTLVGGTSSGSIQLYGSGHSTPNILQYASPDTHKWQCNGVERASLSSAGNLTVGGTLTVNGGTLTLTGAAYPRLTSNGTSGGAFQIQKNGTNYGLFYGNDTDTIIDSNTSSNVVFQTGGATRATVNSSAFTISLTTASNNTSSGALQVVGGVGVGGAANIGGALTVSGTGGIGASASGDVGFKVLSSLTSGSFQYGIYSYPTVNAGTADGGLFGVRAGTSVAVTTAFALRAFTPTLDSGASIASNIGIRVENQGATGITNAFGIDILAQSGASTTNVGLRNAGTTLLTNTTASTTTSSGALVVGNGTSGGLGVGGMISVNGGVGVGRYSAVSGGSARVDINGTGVSGFPQLMVSDTTGRQWEFRGVDASASFILDYWNGAGSRTNNLLTISAGGNLGVLGSVTTGAPTGGTAAAWKLGTVASVSPTSPNRTIEVDIGGTIYYIHAKTTNN